LKESSHTAKFIFTTCLLFQAPQNSFAPDFPIWLHETQNDRLSAAGKPPYQNLWKVDAVDVVKTYNYWLSFSLTHPSVNYNGKQQERSYPATLRLKWQIPIITPLSRESVLRVSWAIWDCTLVLAVRVIQVQLPILALGRIPCWANTFLTKVALGSSVV